MEKQMTTMDKSTATIGNRIPNYYDLMKYLKVNFDLIIDNLINFCETSELDEYLEPLYLLRDSYESELNVNEDQLLLVYKLMSKFNQV